MKIVHVVPHLHTVNGGIQNFAKLIYVGTRERFESDLVGWESRWSTSTLVRLTREIVLRHTPGKLGACLYRNIFSDGVGDYNATNSDLIHFWSLEPAIAFTDMKCIISCHGMELLPKNVKSYRQILYRKALSNALIVQVCSQYTANLVMNQFEVDASKVKIIHPPVDFARLSALARGYKDGNAVPVIGTLTRFVRRKNIPNIIKALNILRERHDLAFIYYLAGDGLEREAILTALKEGKFDWRYFGEISDEEKFQRFYPSLDVFVLPTLELSDDVEGFGIVYLEANSYGIPVVASRAGGVSDAVKENISGVFADPNDPEDIASKILELVNNKKTYADSTRNWAKEFDIKNMAERFGEVYRCAMAQVTQSSLGS